MDVSKHVGIKLLLPDILLWLSPTNLCDRSVDAQQAFCHPYVIYLDDEGCVVMAAERTVSVDHSIINDH